MKKEISRTLKQKISISIGTLFIILIAMVIANIGGIGTYIAEAAQPIQGVFVTNSQTNPIPVNGNVGISGNVGVSGPVSVIGNVGISGFPDVNISNTVPVQDVDNARQPFIENLHIGFSAGNGSGDGSFTVPTGKRLVIEFVSVRAFVPSGQTMLFDFSAITNNIGGGYYLSPVVSTFGVSTVLIANQQMRVYVDPGTTVDLQVFRDSTVQTAQVDATFSGYLVNIV